MPRLRLYDKSAPQNAGGGRMEGILMSRADDRSVVAEVDRFIGAVGAGTLKPSETARQMLALLEGLCFYATNQTMTNSKFSKGGGYTSFVPWKRMTAAIVPVRR